jgi:hypothetical protein
MSQNQVSLFSYDPEEESLRRKESVIQAMQQKMQRGLQPVSVGGHIAAPSMGSLLAGLAENYISMKGGEKLGKEREALADRRAQELREGFEQFDRTSRGGWVEPGNGQAGPPQAVTGDRRKAIFDALASRNPVLRQFAMQQLEAEGKNALTVKDLLPHARGSAIPDMLVRGTAGFQPKRDIGEVGGTIYDKDALETVQLGGAKPMQTVINGDLYEVSPSTGQMRKLDNAPKVSTNVSVGGPVIAGQKAGSEAYFKGAAGKVEALGNQAGQAANVKQTIAEMRNLDSRGIFSNVTSGPATFLTNLGEAIGAEVDTAKLGDTETFNALTTDLWQGLVSKFGGNRGVTKEEALEIKKMLPLATSSPQARQQLYQILDNVANRQIQQYQAADKAFSQAVYQDDPRVFSEGFQGVYLPEPNQPQPVTQPAGQGSPVRRRFNPATGRIE